MTQLNTEYNSLTQSLRSIAITATSSLLRIAPSQFPASVLSFLGLLSFEFLPLHQDDWFPQFPIEAKSQNHATYTPDIAYTIIRLPANLSQAMETLLVLISVSG